ncbi:hypothetical protein E3N88_28056 [Mikania micrantha]|uniref:Uncharacterized protein n=1 Tax=Mikania micrantha TaxID=192012 RepID=A0A5N6N1B0_9ASTR|nr:hypothetical protein E3N88_28056 [Mikania micrantha]
MVEMVVGSPGNEAETKKKNKISTCMKSDEIDQIIAPPHPSRTATRCPKSLRVPRRNPEISDFFPASRTAEDSKSIHRLMQRFLGFSAGVNKCSSIGMLLTYKYRLYLKRISQQQANMVVAFGSSKDSSSYMGMSSLDGLGDYRSLSGSGRLPNAQLSLYSYSGMLGRLNSPTGVTQHSLLPQH